MNGYIDILNRFWDEAPYLPGFKPDYGFLFLAIADSVNRNFWRETEIEYDRIINKTRIGKRMYLEAREWLKENGFITYSKGRNDYARASFNIEVQKCTTIDSSTAPLPSPQQHRSEHHNSTAAVPYLKETINNKTINNKQGVDANRVDDSPVIFQKGKSETFKAPDIEEVEAYVSEKYEMSELASRVFAEKFWNAYESKGWMVGKSKMKKWKSAISANWQSAIDEFKSKYPKYGQKLNGTKYQHEDITDPVPRNVYL